MRIIGAISVAAIFANTIALAQPVPEGVHSDVTGPSSVCGIAGADAPAIRENLKSNPTIVEKASGSPRFETYFSSTESKQWTATTEIDAAHPAVTCVYLHDSGAGTDMQREMRCDASREACDALFREFLSSDAEVRERIKSLS